MKKPPGVRRLCRFWAGGFRRCGWWVVGYLGCGFELFESYAGGVLDGIGEAGRFTRPGDGLGDGLEVGEGLGADS